MLKQIEGLPDQVIGVKAEGRVTKSDYEEVLEPLLETAKQNGTRIRLLYQLGPEFSGITPGAVIEDARVGIKYLRVFERCAVLSHIKWIRQSIDLMQGLSPCPIRSFGIGDEEEAREWLLTENVKTKLKFELRDEGVLLVKPEGKLRREDFSLLAKAVDPWIKAHHELKGVVLRSRKFPGWDNLGSLIRHLEFVKEHQPHVRRVAVAVDGKLPEFMVKLASHFVKAEVRAFPYEKSNEAVEWASRWKSA